MRSFISAAVVAAILGMTLAKVYFQDSFQNEPFDSGRWVVSKWKQDSGEAGKLEWSGGLWPANEDLKGIRTTEDAKFYAASSKMDEPFDNEGKTLVFQLSVKHEQKIDCGGGYFKLFPPETDQENLSGDSKYAVMFGPDICGYSTKKVHAILNHNGENLEKKSEVKSPDDEFSHFYTFVINPDGTYDILVDGKSEDSGDLKEGWAFEKPKKIPDPDAKRPEDWVNDEYMDDPEDKKPEDWDDEPEKIPDPDAKKPEDWEDEDDGEWEAPLIDNPKYKGDWRPKRIKNPDYKGAWVHPEIDNPEWVEVVDVYKRGPVGVVGFEVWQVKAGTVFSNVVLTDSVEEAEQLRKEQQKQVKKSDEEAAKKAYDDAQKPDEPEPEADEAADEADTADLDEKEQTEEQTEEHISAN